MLKRFINPSRNTWPDLVRRPVFDLSSLQAKVKGILEDVKRNGDPAIARYSQEFDGFHTDQLLVGDEEFQKAQLATPSELREAIQTAAANIRKFHSVPEQGSDPIATMPGVECWKKKVPIQKVGLYIPGGSAPLFSTVLMLGIPASIAGCGEVILCTPPSKSGEIHPAILYAASVAGIRSVYRVGGVQAIAAMAYGTGSVPRVFKIFGPGNQYVNCAKQLVQSDGIAIDMPAGPSEVCVLADNSSIPGYVAADLLSQAEHGEDSHVMLVCDSENLLMKVEEELLKQLPALPRNAVAAKSLQNSNAIVVHDRNDAIDLVNMYAPEHLIIATTDAGKVSEQIVNAGSVFIGNYSPESVGDYASGTNHVLPTNGFANSYSGVGVDSFLKSITFQRLSEDGLRNVATAVETMAAAEGLDAHKNAVSIRLKK